MRKKVTYGNNEKIAKVPDIPKAREEMYRHLDPPNASKRAKKSGSLENQLESIWNSVTDFAVNWALNISTDISLFCLPFFVLNSLKLRRRQRIGLAGIFSLGLITMLISTARFVAYIVTDYELDDPSGNAWCTIEMCTAVIVVSLPGLKSLFVQSRSPGNTSDRSTNGYIHTSSRQPSSNRPFAPRNRIDEEALDDELELISYGQNSALATTRTPSETRKPDIEGTVVATTDFTVTRELSGGPN
ncbi:hypothetical protein FOMG_18354 [Fusarium oxysporum f. sp. melonis 26406]|uniref:Rhodopsin domain-containing protein n=1 Tax=Fusarium oxysporum f. sp. melonis 26406 TaxID=1089452 RepID=W9Z9K0_FUSOX|nr:hypothetical protein FOMG_18354 [Fusarium oxysporum f. sp. melonis 26406]